MIAVTVNQEETISNCTGKSKLSLISNGKAYSNDDIASQKLMGWLLNGKLIGMLYLHNYPFLIP